MTRSNSGDMLGGQRGHSPCRKSEDGQVLCPPSATPSQQCVGSGSAEKRLSYEWGCAAICSLGLGRAGSTPCHHLVWELAAYLEPS